MPLSAPFRPLWNAFCLTPPPNRNGGSLSYATGSHQLYFDGPTIHRYSLSPAINAAVFLWLIASLNWNLTWLTSVVRTKRTIATRCVSHCRNKGCIKPPWIPQFGCSAPPTGRGIISAAKSKMLKVPTIVKNSAKKCWSYRRDAKS